MRRIRGLIEGVASLPIDNNTALPRRLFIKLAIVLGGAVGISGLTACGGGGSSDTTAPSVPTNLQASAASTTQIDLTWDASTDSASLNAATLEGYKIYRDGAFLDIATTNSYSDTSLTPDTQYCYKVLAYDAESNESAQSAQACATTLSDADVTAPSVPENLTASVVSESRIRLNWDASIDTASLNMADASGVVGYRVYRGGSLIASVAANTYLDTDLIPGTSYCFRVSAYDGADNESGQGNEACAATPDTGGGNGNPCCFPAGTIIKTPYGDVNIEDVRVDDVILSYDTATDKVVESRIHELEAPIREGYYILNNGLLRLTDEHPVYVIKPDGRKGWASLNPEKTMGESSLADVMQVEKGDDVLKVDTVESGSVLTMVKTKVKIDNIEYLKGQVQTYNLKSVDNFNNFFADGVLVHNKGVVVCFAKGSKVQITKTKTKRIEEIKVGGKVRAFNIKTKKWEVHTVTKLESGNKSEYYVINKKIWVSPNHHFFASGKRKKAPELTLGDTLLDSKLKKVKINSIERVKKSQMRHNIILGKNPNLLYVVNGLLVCNDW